MNKMTSIVADTAIRMNASPFEDLTYRAVVFVRCNGTTPLYSVAGVQGGPWRAEKALIESHRHHGGTCFYCEKKVAKDAGTIDHVEPIASGGNGAIQNLVIACKPCNASKGHQVLDFHNPQAGRKWLEALRLQIDQRLTGL